MEEDEDIIVKEVGNRELLERFIPRGPRLSKSRSLSVYGDKKSSMTKTNIRTVTIGAETDRFPDDMVDKHMDKTEKVTEDAFVAHSDNMSTRNVGLKSVGQRLSFQGIEYYHHDVNRTKPNKNFNLLTTLSGKNYR